MKKKEWIKTICFIAGFFLILIPLTYIIRTNGDIKDIFVGFYAEKEDTVSYTHLDVYKRQELDRLYGGRISCRPYR